MLLSLDIPQSVCALFLMDHTHGALDLQLLSE